jgi:hypothetical protein
MAALAQRESRRLPLWRLMDLTIVALVLVAVEGRRRQLLRSSRRGRRAEPAADDGAFEGAPQDAVPAVTVGQRFMQVVK